MLSFDDIVETEDYIVPKEVSYVPLKISKPWIEKYRPRKLDDILYQIEIIQMLRKTINTGDLPHLLFYGPPGTGKTSTAQSIALELFGPDNVKSRVIELNASDERGINVVRSKIIEFAKSKISTPDPKYPSPPYKIIILDEADAMTIEAQSALRKTMEDNSHITRFFFICNYIHQIIDSIISRCVKFRFKPICSDIIFEKLKIIAKKENIQIKKKLLKKIAYNTKGDMRGGIMLLQNLKYFPVIEEKDVNDILGCLSKYIINKINDSITNKISVNDIMSLVKEIRSYCYPIQNVIEQINHLVIYNKILTESQKGKICTLLADSERKLIEGADEELQLLNIFAQIRKIE